MSYRRYLITKAHTEVKVSKLPKCGFCKRYGKDAEAIYDGKTIFDAWGYMCQDHFDLYGIGLGLGKGQRLIVEKEEL